MEWPRFHPVSSVRPLVSQFPPRSGKHETGHTAGSTSHPPIHVRITPQPPRSPPAYLPPTHKYRADTP